MKATPTLSLVHDIASLNPYRHPLQAGTEMTSHCVFCGTRMNTPHTESCLWVRAIRLFDNLVPVDAYSVDDYR
jgi:hypothetical protein